MPEQFGDKQHEATPHRRQQAREEGQVARSHDLASAIMLLVAVGVLMYWGRSVVDFFGQLAHGQLGSIERLQTDRETLVNQSQGLLRVLAQVVGPIFGVLVLAALASHIGQIGFLFLPQKLTFDLGRISPWKGLQRICSGSNVARLGFGIVKILLVIAVALWSLWSKQDEIWALGDLEVAPLGIYLARITLGTCFKIGLALLVLAILDYAYQRWKHEQELRMTTQELREEMRTLQGDPQIIARRRAVQRQLTLNRLGNAVPKADVVVTNPTELAIAIQYDHEAMDAPVVVAKGAGVVAQRIRRLALEHSIPVVERKELAQALYKQVDIGKTIPPEQYAAMAEVLRYVYQLKGKTLPGARSAA